VAGTNQSEYLMNQFSQKLIASMLLLAAVSTTPVIGQTQKKTATKQDPVAQIEKELVALKSGDTTLWTCENKLQMKTAISKNGEILLVWDKKIHKLQLQESLPGAQRYMEPTSKIELLIIPDKSMLFDSKLGQRLVDYCKTQEMTLGGKPPVYNNPQ
jgi:hypothetical protein